MLKYDDFEIESFCRELKETEENVDVDFDFNDVSNFKSIKESYEEYMACLNY